MNRPFSHGSLDVTDEEPEETLATATCYQRIYAIIEQIPAGRVATYGQVAAVEGRCSASMVGYALAALPDGQQTPWQRVINRQGTVSERRGGGGTTSQRDLLMQEGVLFDEAGRVDFAMVGWLGPDPAWLDLHQLNPPPPPPAPRGKGRSR